ncbi:serologically defined colon cancer antigen 8 isoform X9 [Pseudorca crassidens]|uniref:serologically defined colon cancer antigen 8 isoform X9 n=1 Tax=Pseudorca crassidens TaxID=82174 RepID=UPI00352C995F
MAKSPENSALEEILGQYQRSLRERASRSIHQLKCALREGDVTIGEDVMDPSFSISVGNEDAGNAWHKLQHSHAVNQLKALLCQQATKESEVSPRRRKLSPLKSSEYEETDMPALHNFVPIISDQSQYIHHLEAEVKFCKEELSGMKNRVQVIVLENERLQQELKSQRQEETMREQTLLDASGNIQNSWITTGEDSRVDEAAKRSFSHGNADIIKAASASEAEKWKLELALIQCEQLKNELEKQTERLEKELASQREKRAFEKEMMKREITKEREDMGSKTLTLSQSIAQLEAQVEKITREKISAVNQLEEIQNQLASREMDVTKVCGEMRYQLNKTKMEKDEAEKEHREYRTKTKRDLEIKDQEIEKLSLELSESKQHLEQEQQKATRAREECLKLTELLGKSEHQLHLTRLEKDSIQQSFSNDAKAQALQAQQREQELTQKIQQMEAQHDKTENEQYSLLTSQNSFLTKLKEECCTLAKKLEQISQKSRSEIAQLSQEKRYTCDKLEKLQRRNDELEEQCVQHGRLHEIMKQSLSYWGPDSKEAARVLTGQESQDFNSVNNLCSSHQKSSVSVPMH